MMSPHSNEPATWRNCVSRRHFYVSNVYLTSEMKKPFCGVATLKYHPQRRINKKVFQSNVKFQNVWRTFYGEVQAAHVWSRLGLGWSLYEEERRWDLRITVQ